MEPSPSVPSQPIVPEPAWSGRSAWGFCCGSCCLLFLGLILFFGYLLYHAGTSGAPQRFLDKALEYAGVSTTRTGTSPPTPTVPTSTPDEPDLNL